MVSSFLALSLFWLLSLLATIAAVQHHSFRQLANNTIIMAASSRPANCQKLTTRGLLTHSHEPTNKNMAFHLFLHCRHV